MRRRLEYDVPIYETVHYKYVKTSDFKERDGVGLEIWIFGYPQPLIQGEGKGVPAILDAVFFDDYIRYMQGEKSPLDIV